VKERARREPLVEVERALADLERDPAAASLAVLRCAAWLREARDDLAPVDEERGRLVFERWMAEARLAHPDAARESAAVSAGYWSSDPEAIPSLAALDRLATALGAALALGRWNPYDADGDVADPLLDLASLTTSEAAQQQRERLKADLTARAPSEPLLVTVWMQLSSGKGAKDVPGLPQAGWDALRRLVAVMPATAPAKRWGRVHGELVARLRWRSAGDDFIFQEAARARAGPIVLFFAAETSIHFVQAAKEPEQAHALLRRAWAFLERVPTDERDQRQLSIRARIEDLALARAPWWFIELPAAERPPALLPEGLRFGDRAGDYIRVSDGAVLEWASGSFRVAR
jgi:hypothetical protein